MTKKTLILGIGAQRAGTTWLFDYLAQHPDIFTGLTKEFHFWDEYFLDGGARWTARLKRAYSRVKPWRWAEIDERLTIKDPATYFNYFDRLNTENRSYVLDITPSYALMTRENFEEIGEQATRAGYKVKLIYVLRDPVDRFCSHLNFDAGKNGRMINFGHGLNGGPGARSRYDVTFKAVQNLFPLTVEFFETMTVKKDTTRLMEALELQHIPPTEEQRTNSSTTFKPMTEGQIALARETFMPAYEYVNDRFGGRKPAGWRA